MQTQLTFLAGALFVIVGINVVEANEGGPGNLGNLWCVGDSWTACYLGQTWRRTLSQELKAAGWTVNFVGTRTTPWRCEEGQRFDRDHNGIRGITAAEVLNNRLPVWLPKVTPDTMLLLLGGNDYNGSNLPAITANIAAIIDRIRADNPNVVIHLGTYGYVGLDRFPDSAVDESANQMQTLVAAKTTAQSPIYFVDHRAAWDKSIHVNSLDRFHPTKAGLKKLAANWLASIQAHQTGFVPATIQYQPDQMIGVRTDRQSGANRFSKSGRNQRLNLVSRKGRKLTFYFSIENDGNRRDSIALRSSGGSRYVDVAIFQRNKRLKNVSAAVQKDRYRIRTDPGETVRHRLVVTQKPGKIPRKVSRTFFLRAMSQSDPGKRDAVQAHAKFR